MSKSHPEQWTINVDVERPDRSLVEALRAFATTQIADCGAPVGVVGPGLHRLAGARLRRLAVRALVAEAAADQEPPALAAAQPALVRGAVAGRVGPPPALGPGA